MTEGEEERISENIVWVTRWMPLRTTARSMGWGRTDTRLVNHDIVNPIRAPRRKGTSRQDPKDIFAVDEDDGEMKVACNDGGGRR